MPVLYMLPADIFTCNENTCEGADDLNAAQDVGDGNKPVGLQQSDQKHLQARRQGLQDPATMCVFGFLNNCARRGRSGPSAA